MLMPINRHDTQCAHSTIQQDLGRLECNGTDLFSQLAAFEHFLTSLFQWTAPLALRGQTAILDLS